MEINTLPFGLKQAIGAHVACVLGIGSTWNRISSAVDSIASSALHPCTRRLLPAPAAFSNRGLSIYHLQAANYYDKVPCPDDG